MQTGRRAPAIGAAAAALLAAQASGAPCESLADLELAHTEITLAESVDRGAFRTPAAVRRGPFAGRLERVLAELPAFCRVAATARPTSDSAIKLEVWIPETGWNGKLQSVGNGAWAGSLSYPAMAEALGAGFAAASTDTGHEGGSGDFAVGHPERLVDFAHRAVHDMTVAAKAIVAAHTREPDYAYFVGCSTGGRQALAEAQRYPDDYDGIVAGAAAYHPTHLQGAQIWTAIVGHAKPGAAVSADQLPLLNAAVVAACDPLDGVADGVLESPNTCGFDPGALVCASDATTACLSAEQAETVRRIYAGPATASGTTIFPGVSRGSELGWQDRVSGEPISLAVDTYRYLVFEDPSWDYRTFDPERDIPKGVDAIAPIMNSTDADLEPFLSRGGKLLLYHGWNDPGIPAMSTVAYYENVRAAVAPEIADEGVRLFMVPGMNHCGGGVGTDQFDAVTALDRWVVDGAAPERIEAARIVDGETVRTRPLCPYPEVAAYDGRGGTDESASFSCRER